MPNAIRHWLHSTRCVMLKTWGTSPNVVHWIYTTIISRMLTYAAVIWWPWARYITVSKQLTHVQRLACLHITRAMRTTPTAAIELLVGLVPLPTFIHQEAMMPHYRLCATSKWIAGGGKHAKISQRMAQLIPLLWAHCDRRVQKYYFDKYFTVQVPSREQ